jgi:hypothetical protein
MTASELGQFTVSIIILVILTTGIIGGLHHVGMMLGIFR